MSTPARDDIRHGGVRSDAVRVVLPAHLRAMAKVQGEISVEIPGEVTQRAVLDAVEQQFPMLLGTIRDRETAKRRAFVRFFGCGEDLSHEEPDSPLPDRIVRGEEPFMVIGAMAGG
jgi:sulfur-carrier protein